MRTIVIMGVAGCGKSTIADAISKRISACFIEGDEFHPPENVRKMSTGIPLTDADRQGWLQGLALEITDRARASERVIVACSALKRSYRDTLRQASPDLGFVFLELTPEQAMDRVSQRSNHFMPASLVESQFRDLEPPRDEPLVLSISAIESIKTIADKAISWWSTINA
ncbi:MAG TPA: gluconokinase [Dyella sp.]|nr:gluconokinase [Dyella sp.]